MNTRNNGHAKGYDFPFFVPVAALEYKQNTLSMPFMCPLKYGGLAFIHDDDVESAHRAVQGIEQVVLSIISVVGPGVVHVREYDFSIAKRFQHLFDLRGTLRYKYAANPSSAEDDFLELVELARYRHREVLSPGAPDIYSFNRLHAVPQPYQLVLLHISDFPFERIEEGMLTDFLRTAFEAGVIFLAYGNTQAVKTTARKGAATLLERVPTIEIASRSVKVQPEECFSEVVPITPRDAWTLQPLKDFRGGLVHAILESQTEESTESDYDFLSVPIGVSLDGRREARFTLGKRSGCYHALVVGNTGTGKTTLINNIITEIAHAYTANDVVLYLMDYKEGVEFQHFAQHPNVAKIFLDNKNYSAAFELLTEFASLIEERGNIFKTRGVRDIDEYNGKYSDSAIPHVILIIDEAQRLFSDDYSRSQEFDEMLQDVASRGRSFGVHIILSTQNILEMNISPRTLEQITLRIVFRLSSERATYKVLGYDNLAPLHLGKYEFVYNPMSGAPEANSLCRANPPIDFAKAIKQLVSARTKDEILVPKIASSSPMESGGNVNPREQTEASPEESLTLLIDSLNEIERQFDTTETPAFLEDDSNPLGGGTS